MKQLIKPGMFKVLMTALVFLLAVKFLWFVVEIIWLPASGINEAQDQGSKSLYYRVKLTPSEAPAPQKEAPRAVKIAGSINDIKLLAIYNASDLVVVAVEYQNKTKVLSSGEQINGFALESAGNNFAMFSKEGKNYKVMLIKSNNISPSSGSITNALTAIQKAPDTKKVEGEVTDAGDHKIIDRSLLDHYASNMDDIYKNIGVGEIKEGNALQGFRITFVKKDSPFSKLGIQRDDVIKSINGQEIKSYNAALDVYKNIGQTDNLTLVIERGKQEMELEYEIN